MKKENPLKLKAKFKTGGDQLQAISALVKGIEKGMPRQTLLGATGTGKTFTMANVIAETGKPALVIAHNKTLAAQLAQEFKEFFPDAAVHYFVSYYDYYQPEAYMPVTDTYIEKDAQINQEIDRLRHASTQALLTRKDVIIVASVSCIYGLGSPEEYEKENFHIKVGDSANRTDFLKRLVHMHYERTNADLTPGTFRSIGNRVDIMPVSETIMYQVEILGGAISRITKIDPFSSALIAEMNDLFLFLAKHFMTANDKLEKALKNIKDELAEQLKYFEREGKPLEAERIKRRTNYDLAMIREVGYCSGIENYSRHLSGKNAGEPPETLLSYFPHNKKGEPEFLTFIDESHVTLPQLQGMYAGDASSKNTLVEFGFRLPSAKDNRPLRYEEFTERVGQTIYVSATPGKNEREDSKQVVEQIIRPTGLVDPEVILRPVTPAGNYVGQTRLPSGTGKAYGGQVQDFIIEAEKTIERGFRVLATTLTKKMAEDLTIYLKDRKIKAEYLHSDIKTIDRIQILTKFRKGEFDVLVGVNLLREGLDLPEVALIGILDADKEGFLRSETALIQTIGRAARNVDGRVILYADRMTGTMERAINETDRRREKQRAYNLEHGITPETIKRNIHDIVADTASRDGVVVELEDDGVNNLVGHNLRAYSEDLEKRMRAAAADLEFEEAGRLRDEIRRLEADELGLPDDQKRAPNVGRSNEGKPGTR